MLINIDIVLILSHFPQYNQHFDNLLIIWHVDMRINNRNVDNINKIRIVYPPFVVEKCSNMY